jgi:integrase
MKNSLTTHLYQYKNSSNYFFRIRRGFFRSSRYHVNKGYFIASLQTACVREAKWLAAFIRMEFEKEMENEIMMLKTGNQRKSMAEMFESASGDEFMLMDRDFAESIKEDAITAAIRQRFDDLLVKGKSFIKLGIGSNSDFKVDLEVEDINSIVVNDKTSNTAAKIVSRFTDSEITMPNAAGAPTRLLQECLKANQKVMATLIEWEQKREHLGESNMPDMKAVIEMLSFRAFQYELNDDLQEAKFIETKAHEHYSLSHQYSVFREEKAREITSKSIEKYDYAISILVAELGASFDCRLFDKKVTQRIKSVLIKLKKNAGNGNAGNKKAKFLSAKTINMQLSNYRVFLSWFIANNDVAMDNPFKDLSVKANKRELIKRRPLEPAEIKQILDYQWAHGSECRGYRADAQLFIKVALYSGMRLNEIASIRLEDIKQIDGVWVFDLRSKKLKSWNAQRTVPIAQYLLDLGLIDIVKTLKKQKRNFLFSDVRRQLGSNANKGFGEPVSRWFNRTALKNIGINKEKEQKQGFDVVFHCLRNTFITELVSAGAQHHHIKRVVGHAQDDDVTLDSYADVSKISLQLLKTMMDENLKWHI